MKSLDEDMECSSCATASSRSIPAASKLPVLNAVNKAKCITRFMYARDITSLPLIYVHTTVLHTKDEHTWKNVSTSKGKRYHRKLKVNLNADKRITQ